MSKQTSKTMKANMGKTQQGFFNATQRKKTQKLTPAAQQKMAKFKKMMGKTLKPVANVDENGEKVLTIEQQKKQILEDDSSFEIYEEEDSFYDEYIDVKCEVESVIEKKIREEIQTRRKLFEWSGQDVKPLQDPVMTKIALQSLSQIRVWPKGFHGFVKLITNAFKIGVKSNMFDNLMIFSVTMNTVVLALDGYGISNELATALD
jgi:hypothetical protein